MSGDALAVKPLVGHRVAFTGRLACLSRAEAIKLVRRSGGSWSRRVTSATSMLVIGQDGWPFRKDGRLTRKLLQARRLSRLRPLTVISEADLLMRLGLEAGPRRHLSTAQLSQALATPGERIRGWVESGLMQPVETIEGIHYFDFRQASWAKRLSEFAQNGAAIRRLRRSLLQLRSWLPEADETLAQLNMLEGNGRLTVRLDHDLIAEPSGQLCFDFSEKRAEPSSLPVAAPRTEDWFERARGHEANEQWPEAIRAYRKALRSSGPDSTTCFNLANALYASGEREQAVERYYQAAELEPGFAEAWNNLGIVLGELKRHEEAIEALGQALMIDPLYGDAHYNLADLLEESGRPQEARPHWRAYLNQERAGPHAAHASRRLRRSL
jgi:tetratricopeptide (TPR) repeat protein